jgi:hypothetical protein
MPLPPPVIDDRNYRQLVDDTLARVPVHTPEWTNFNASDPGVTLVQLFAFLTENLIYRANQIPTRNRAKFLRLLGIGLNPANEARGLVAFANAKGPLAARTLPANEELLAGKLPFRTVAGLSVLPVEARAYAKRLVTDASPELRAYYQLLYASYDKTLDPSPTSLSLYQSVAFDPRQGPFDPADTTDRSLWIAILARKDDIKPTDPLALDEVRASLAGQTLSLGLSPAQDSGQRVLKPGAASMTPNTDALTFEIARPNANGELDFDSAGLPQPVWRILTSRFDFDPTVEPGVVEITLPSAAELALWSNLDPLEAGVGDLPPALEDPALNDRLVTWLRLRVANAANVRLEWVGINAAIVRQLETIRAERLSDGDGTPNQTRQLARSPVLAGSVALTSIRTDGSTVDWSPIDDLLAAAPEVTIDGGTQPLAPATSYRIDAEAGVITFGDGLAGQRPAPGERLYVRYDICAGQAGNLGPGAIKEGPAVPSGITATNPIRTGGGADAEQVADGERQVQRFLQHRDRLVTAEDFRTIAFRTPGVAIGRIEVVPAWHPDLAPAALGSAPGTVTLMAIPATDPLTPAAPRADDRFLGALCRYLDPRRLVTTELVLRGADYKGVWVSIGITAAGGHAIAEVTDAVKARIRAYLSPLPADSSFAASTAQLYGPDVDPALRGWPLGRPVHARAILAEAARVPGVTEVADVLLALGNGPAVNSIDISGIELPEILGLSVTSGDPIDLAALRGDAVGAGAGGTAGKRLLPVPIVPETC